MTPDTHPAKLSKKVERSLFDAMYGALKSARPHVAASAEASHLLQGFAREETQEDRLLQTVDAAIANAEREIGPAAGVVTCVVCGVAVVKVRAWRMADRMFCELCGKKQ
jgi:hypothetical protein